MPARMAAAALTFDGSEEATCRRFAETLRRRIAVADCDMPE
jgi:hypothetical protein